MTWTSPADLRDQAQRLWDKGAILSALATGESIFPKRLNLKGPTAAELQNCFEDVRDWVQRLQQMPHIRIEMREFRHRILGANALPAAAWLDDLSNGIALLSKKKELRTFVEMLQLTQERQPALRAWLAKRPLLALTLSEVWPLLLDVVDWMCAHPRPRIYLRQMDIPGVHSKFVEAHRGVLCELLDLTLPIEALDPTATGAAQFSRRHGFLGKPERIRFRILDPACSPLRDLYTPDITLDAESFSEIELSAAQVFITENETNFLAFPPVHKGVVIFGAGYGFAALGQARWLNDNNCRLHYWGDIDTHGFAILDGLRNHFYNVESFLMDRHTLNAFKPLWGFENTPLLRNLPRLTNDEQALYNDLRDNCIRPNLRLEQERISFGWVLAALAKLG